MSEMKSWQSVNEEYGKIMTPKKNNIKMNYWNTILGLVGLILRFSSIALASDFNTPLTAEQLGLM